MFKSKKARILAVGCAVAALPASYAVAQSGGGVPADKVAAAGSKRVVIAAGQTETIMSATFKTSKPSDLMIQTALECSIFTQLLTNNTDNSATAGARVRVWVELDGKIVRVQSISTPPQDPAAQPAGDDSDKATFCDREYSRTVTDDETNVPLDGIDAEDDYIRTKSTHGFNWIRMNAGSGIHRLDVKAELTTNSDGQATAEAEIGNRTLIVEPTKMANNAVIAENGTSTSGN